MQSPSSLYFPAYAQGPHGPPPMVLERFHSVISQLFQYVCAIIIIYIYFSLSLSTIANNSTQLQRIIRCGGPVDDDMANILVSQLLYLDALDPNKVCMLSIID